MMTGRLMDTLAFASPIVSALVCMVMMLMNAYSRTHKHDLQEKRLRLFLALTYLVTSLGWLGLVFYSARPRFFVCYYTVFLLTLMLDQVLIYRFVSIITGTGQSRRFNYWHVIVPFIITAVALVISFTVSVDEQTVLIFSSAGNGESHLLFRMMYIFTTVVFVVYNTLYPFINLRNIRRYREFIGNYSSDTYRNSLGWLATIQTLILICVPLPFAALLIGLNSAALSVFAWLGAIPYFVNYLLLCYNLLNDNYLVIRPEDTEEDTPDKSIAIDRKTLDRYLRDAKPYLNPQLRITDLAVHLNSNRTYLSAFINKEYGMNFCRLINRYRLKELERMCLLPSNAARDNMELVLAAGFTGYRSYLRAKREEDRMALVKAFG